VSPGLQGDLRSKAVAGSGDPATTGLVLGFVVGGNWPHLRPRCPLPQRSRGRQPTAHPARRPLANTYQRALAVLLAFPSGKANDEPDAVHTDVRLGTGNAGTGESPLMGVAF